MPWLNFAGAWLVVFLVLVAAAMGLDEAIRQLKRWWFGHDCEDPRGSEPLHRAVLREALISRPPRRIMTFEPISRAAHRTAGPRGDAPNVSPPAHP